MQIHLRRAPGRRLRVLWLAAAALVALVTLANAAGTGSAEAARDRVAACPAPKPLPAGLKQPPKGASATRLANFLLALPQRKPCDVNLFTSTFFNGGDGFYPEGRPMMPATGPVPTEAQVRSQLSSYFAGSAQRTSALAFFDRADVKAKLADPTLRASLASLRGTVAEPVIAYLLSGTYAVPPRFCACLPNATKVAGAIGSAKAIFFNARYQSEHLALLTGVMAHEPLHHDFQVTATEEVLLHALTAMVHMQVLSRHPELATSGTELSRQLNVEVLLFVNSRAPGSSRSAIVASRGKGTAPGSARSQGDLYRHGKDFKSPPRTASPADNSPAPPIFVTVLRKLLAPGVAIPKPLTYSKKTALLFSKLNDTWLSPVDRLRVSVLLGLVSMDEITKYTGLTRAKAISTFRLSPILRAMK